MQQKSSLRTVLKILSWLAYAPIFLLIILASFRTNTPSFLIPLDNFFIENPIPGSVATFYLVILILIPLMWGSHRIRNFFRDPNVTASLLLIVAPILAAFAIFGVSDPSNDTFQVYLLSSILLPIIGIYFASRISSEKRTTKFIIIFLAFVMIFEIVSTVFLMNLHLSW